MSAQWKPGDMAVITTLHGDQWYAIVRPHRAANGGLEFAYVTGGYDMVDELATGFTARPLVVVDPERIAGVTDSARYIAELLRGTSIPTLRDLADAFDPKPPKPDEPMGLGAVVEDDKGTPWFRMAVENQTWPGEVWQEQYGDADRWSKWESVNAVRVLSDGVKAGDES